MVRRADARRRGRPRDGARREHPLRRRQELRRRVLNDAVQQVVDGHLADVDHRLVGRPTAATCSTRPAPRHAFDDVLLMAAGTGIGVPVLHRRRRRRIHRLRRRRRRLPGDQPVSDRRRRHDARRSAPPAQRLGESAGRPRRASSATRPNVAAAKACTEAQDRLTVAADRTPLVRRLGRRHQLRLRRALATRKASCRRRSPDATRPDGRCASCPTSRWTPTRRPGCWSGETQTFPDGVYYDQYRIGGTSLVLAAVRRRDGRRRPGRPAGRSGSSTRSCTR